MTAAGEATKICCGNRNYYLGLARLPSFRPSVRPCVRAECESATIRGHDAAAAGKKGMEWLLAWPGGGSFVKLWL